MKYCIGLIALSSCVTPIDYAPEIDSLKLELAAMDVRTDDLDDKVQSLETLCTLNRDNLKKLQTALKPTKRRKK